MNFGLHAAGICMSYAYAAYDRFLHLTIVLSYRPEIRA